MKPYLACFLSWETVDRLIKKQLRKMTGKEICCKTRYDAWDYWSLDMEGYRMEESELRSLAERLSVAEQDYLDAIPEEEKGTISGLGLEISFALLSQATGLQWQRYLAEEGGLWLIGCRRTFSPCGVLVGGAALL